MVLSFLPSLALQILLVWGLANCLTHVSCLLGNSLATPWKLTYTYLCLHLSEVVVTGFVWREQQLKLVQVTDCWCQDNWAGWGYNASIWSAWCWSCDFTPVQTEWRSVPLNMSTRGAAFRFNWFNTSLTFPQYITIIRKILCVTLLLEYGCVSKCTENIRDSPLNDVQSSPAVQIFSILTPPILVPKYPYWRGLSNGMLFDQIWYHYGRANQDLVPKKAQKQPIFGVVKLDAQCLVPFCNTIKMG